MYPVLVARPERGGAEVGHRGALGAQELELGAQLGDLAPGVGQLDPQPIVVVLGRLQASPHAVAVVQVRGNHAADQVLALLEPPVYPLTIIQTLHTFHALPSPLTGWVVGRAPAHHGLIGQPDDRDPLG